MKAKNTFNALFKKDAPKNMLKVILLLTILFQVMLLSAGCTVFRGNADPGAVSSAKIPVLMYHHLVPVATSALDLENGAVISAEQFAEQMTYLSENGYTTWFLSELFLYLESGEPLPEKTVVITFDDGYESNYLYAYPVLKQYNFKASISLILSKMEKVEAALAKSGVQDPANGISGISVVEAKEMMNSGLVEFHSHTYDMHHTVSANAAGKIGYPSVDRMYLAAEGRAETEQEYGARIGNDLLTAARLLKNYLDIDSTALIYPYGRYNDQLIEAAKTVGVYGAATVKAGLVDKNSEVFALPRVTVGPKDNLASFVRKLAEGK